MALFPKKGVSKAMSTVLSSILKIWDRVPQNGKEALISNLGIKDQNALKLGGAVLRHYIDNAKPIDPYLESQKVVLANVQEKEQMAKNVESNNTNTPSNNEPYKAQANNTTQQGNVSQQKNEGQGVNDFVNKEDDRTPKPRRSKSSTQKNKSSVPYKTNKNQDMDDDIIDVEWIEIKK